MCSVYADQITIINETQKTIFIATYYRRGLSITRSGEINKLEANQEVIIERPSRKLLYDRELFVTENGADLKKTLSKEELKTISHVNIGSLQGIIFHIEMQEESFILSSKKSLKKNLQGAVVAVTKKMVPTTLVEFKKNFLQSNPLVAQNQYREDVARVRLGPELSLKEQEFRKNREVVVRKNLQKYLGLSDSEIVDKKVPLIGFVTSGGGYRAMVSTFGFMVGAQETGLLDIATYWAALSGSTWALGSWMVYNDQSMRAVQGIIFDRIQKNITDITRTDLLRIIRTLSVRYLSGQPITIVDIYGLLLVNRLFDGDLDLQLQAQYDSIKNGEKPYPIYTAVEARINAKLINSWAESKPWVEFTPDSFYLNGYGGITIPIWSLGRYFENGVSINKTPGILLSKVFAICGSAFAASLETTWKTANITVANPDLQKTVMDLLEKHGEKSISLTRGEELNVVKGMENSQFDIDLKTRKIMKFKDAGLFFNLPTDPLLGSRPQRKMDLLLILDASAGLAKGEATELEKASKYAQLRGLKFPKIGDTKQIARQVISIFEDMADSDVPIVIYLPLYNDKSNEKLKDFDIARCIGDKKGCNTFNFQWGRDISEKLSLLAENNMRLVEPQIKEIIRKIFNRINGSSNL